MGKKKVSPSNIFHFTQVDKTDGIISMDHVTIVRWDGNRVASLAIYCNEGPLILLDEKQGKKFIERMVELDDYRRATLDFLPGSDDASDN